MKVLLHRKRFGLKDDGVDYYSGWCKGSPQRYSRRYDIVGNSEVKGKGRDGGKEEC